MKLLLILIFLASYSNSFAQFGGLFDAIKDIAEPEKKKSSPEKSGLLNIPNQTSREDVLKNDIDHIYTWTYLEEHSDPFGNYTTHSYTFKGKFIGIWTEGSRSFGVQFEDTTYVDIPRYHDWRPDGKGGQIACLKYGEKLRWEQLSDENEQLINWCLEKLKIHREEEKIAAEKLAAMKKAEAERKELEAAEQRELTISKLKNDFPRVKEVGNSMKDKTFVFKSIYLGMPIWDARSALLATEVGDVQDNLNSTWDTYQSINVPVGTRTSYNGKIYECILDHDYNNAKDPSSDTTNWRLVRGDYGDSYLPSDNRSSFKKVFIFNKISLRDLTTSHDVISELKSEKPLTLGASDQEKLKINTKHALEKIKACNGVSGGDSDGKIDVIEIYEQGLKDLFKLDDDIDLLTLVKIISEVFNIEFVEYGDDFIMVHVHVDYDKGFVLRLMSKQGELSLKLLKIPSVSEIQAAKKAAEEAKKKKFENALENARSAFD